MKHSSKCGCHAFAMPRQNKFMPQNLFYLNITFTYFCIVLYVREFQTPIKQRCHSFLLQNLQEFEINGPASLQVLYSLLILKLNLTLVMRSTFSFFSDCGLGNLSFSLEKIDGQNIERQHCASGYQCVHVNSSSSQVTCNAGIQEFCRRALVLMFITLVAPSAEFSPTILPTPLAVYLPEGNGHKNSR